MSVNLNRGNSSFFSIFLSFLDCYDDVAARLHSRDIEENASGYSELSGKLYSIYMLADTKLKVMFRPWWLVWLIPIRLALWCVTWLPLGAWCYWRALPLSNKVVTLLGYDRMPSDMCYIRQNILSSHGKYQEARKCSTK